MLKGLDDEQLAGIQEILAGSLDHLAEFKSVMVQLKTLGLKENHIQDLHLKAGLMKRFLNQIPDISARLDIAGTEYDLLDHLQLYFLGLPNKLGPLAFVTLRHVLQQNDDASEDMRIVDIMMEPISSSSINDKGVKTATSKTRRRRQADNSEESFHDLIRDVAIEDVRLIINKADNLGNPARTFYDAVFRRDN